MMRALSYVIIPSDVLISKLAVAVYVFDYKS